MLEFARWKYVLAALIFVVGILYSLPNLYPQDTALQITAARGGSVNDALTSRVSAVLDEADVGYKSIALEDGNLLVRLQDPNTQIRAADRVREALGNNYVVALNLASTVPAWLEAIGAYPMVLGLDLQGGVHFLMEVDQAGALEKRENAFAEDIRVLLRDNSIGYAQVDRGTSGIDIRLSNREDRNRAAMLIGRELPELTVANGPTPDTLQARIREAELKTILDNALEQNIGTLRNRINELGVAEPVIQRQGESRIVVQLPGVQDTAQAKKILGATATLEYRAVVGDGLTDAYEAQRTGRVPPDARLYNRREVGADGKPVPVLLSRRVIASGDQLIDARSGFDPQDGSPMVSVRLNAVGGKRMLDFTTENVGRGMAVVFIERTPETRMVDGEEVRTVKITEEVISVANIRGVFSNRFSTTGLSGTKEASDLALLLRAGSLAAPVDIVSERIVGPSLGAANIESGWKAVAYSFIFVLIFFIVYYRVFGLITNIALLLNMLLVVAVMSILGATLTLPGLAGIALTVALSVDANVLINERIREELRAGNSPLNSIATGYDKASGTIWDANITALLAGIALFSFGTGPVKGFAVSMCLGIITSMYTAVSISRGVATLIYGGRRKLTRLSI
ncbi:MAG: protein translocase subunit SecD [Lysobacteraceae bacterium]